MTRQELQLQASYDKLKAMGLSDQELRQFYSLPNNQRGAYLRSFKDVKSDVKKEGTQMCTSVSVASVRRMALDHMERDWVFRGRTFNLNNLGWRFEIEDCKRANGRCYSYQKKITLSRYVIEHSDREMSGWINTMVHEIAHAINHMLGGRGHDRQWKTIFEYFGGSGERCSSDVTFSNLIEKPISKYTQVCPNGCQAPVHRYAKAVDEGRRACGKCCKKHNNGKFDKRFILKLVQNY